MSAPVIFHMFLNLMAYVCIGDRAITTISLNEAVSNYYTGASEIELFHAKSKNSKNISFQPRVFKRESNLTVITSTGKIYSFVLRKCETPHTIILIKDGVKDLSLQLTKKNHDFIIESGKHSHVFKAKAHGLIVNSKNLRRNESIVIPKGSPIFVNDRRILN